MALMLFISDACEHAVGGLIIVNGIGFTWQFIIPDEWMDALLQHQFLGIVFGASQCIKYVCAFITGQRLLSLSGSMNILSWLVANKFDCIYNLVTMIYHEGQANAF